MERPNLYHTKREFLRQVMRSESIFNPRCLDFRGLASTPKFECKYYDCNSTGGLRTDDIEFEQVLYPCCFVSFIYDDKTPVKIEEMRRFMMKSRDLPESCLWDAGVDRSLDRTLKIIVASWEKGHYLRIEDSESYLAGKVSGRRKVLDRTAFDDLYERSGSSVTALRRLWRLFLFGWTDAESMYFYAHTLLANVNSSEKDRNMALSLLDILANRIENDNRWATAALIYAIKNNLKLEIY